MLLAEAVTRGWITGDAAELYQSGVRAHMQQMAEYSPIAAISDAAITTYLNAHPLVPATALEQINPINHLPNSENAKQKVLIGAGTVIGSRDQEHISN